MRIYSKDAINLTKQEEAYCKKLVSGGAIYSLYVECCEPENKSKNRIFIAKKGPCCIAWAVIKQEQVNLYQFMVYVKLKYRRKGIGSDLYQRAKKYFNLKDKNISVSKTGNVSKKFFSKIKNN